MLTLEDIRKKCITFSKQYWGVDFCLPVSINSRLSSLFGKYKWTRIKDSQRVYNQRLEFSKKFIETYDEEIIDTVIKHELTHWILHSQGKPFKDGHPVFEQELARVGGTTTRLIPDVGTKHYAICAKCHKEAAYGPTFESIKKYIGNKRYHSRCCKMTIQYGGVKYTDQEDVKVMIQEHLELSKIVQKGKRGVTNAQMIPAMKQAIVEHSIEKLQLLKKHYPKVFESSKKYLGGTYYEKLDRLTS